MAAIKCKMCGGDLKLIDGESVAECEYCGTRQTVPTADSEKKLTLFGRAGRLLRACEFDKAAGVFESIVADFPEEAEAYWGLVLCKYGIEYVDDPVTGKKVPTCHRSSFESVLDDDNFDQACENAEPVARRLYRDEAKAIEELRRDIIEVSGKEAPYDIFICYKETDDNGNRTLDSVLAQDIYDALTEKGYRVFFSRVSLEDKLGQEYEPYIFAALNSAKLMLAVGTDYDYFNAVWVKNEWSRFLHLIAGGQKKTLIPCYKNIDAYDMPKEFAKLQAQDLGKVGAMQDLLRGVDKIMGKGQEQQPKAAPVVQQSSAGPTVESLYKRGQIYLADGEWDKADEYFDKALDINPEYAQAYFGKMMVARRAKDIGNLKLIAPRLTNDAMFQKAHRFADAIYRDELDEIARSIEELHQEKMQKRQSANSLARVYIAAGLYHSLGLNSDGNVVAYGDGLNGYYNKYDNGYGQCNVRNWSNIIAVSAGDFHSVGLTSNGKVRAVGKNQNHQCNVSKWAGIIAVAAGSTHTVGLKSSGTVMAAGLNKYGECDVSGWSDVVSVAAGSIHTVGLKSDGTVVAAGANTAGQCDVKEWKDIIAVSAAHDHTVGLRSDGTLVTAGDNKHGQCNVSGWTDIVAVSSAGWYTVGLRADGTVVATGDNEKGQCNVSNWKDIIAISAGGNHTMGLKRDGTVVSTNLESKVFSWKLFDTIDSLN